MRIKIEYEYSDISAKDIMAEIELFDIFMARRGSKLIEMTIKPNEVKE